MRYLNLTLPRPVENVALEEALCDAAGQDPANGEVLRTWESPTHFVAAGSASRLAEDVDLDACSRDGVPVLRRASGGGTVLQGPGCLNFTLVLSYRRSAELGTIEGAFGYVLSRVIRALGTLGHEVQKEGISDLCLQGRKTSGSGQRRRRDHVLVHGTVLCGLDLARVSRYLRQPARQPAYRRNRPHDQFMTNLPVDPAAVRDAMVSQWQATEVATDWPRGLVDRLVQEKYTTLQWLNRR